VIDVAFSPDGSILATALSDNSVGLWGVDNLVELGTLTGHTDQVWSVAFSPDAYYIASGSLDNTVQLWGVTKR
jgi:WD40 repeat protein